MASNPSNPTPIRPLGLLIYRKGELDKTEVLMQIKDGKYFVPSCLRNEGEECFDAAARLAAGELGVNGRDLLVNPLTTGTSDHPDFRYTMMVATPRAELFARAGRGGGQTALKWADLDTLGKVQLHPELSASHNALGLAIRCMDEPDTVLDPQAPRKKKPSRSSSRRSSRRSSSFLCF